jgi:hypothetical protein
MEVKKIVAGSLCALALLTAGCLSRPVQVAASSDPIEQGRYSVLGAEVSGTDTQVMFFGMRWLTRRVLMHLFAWRLTARSSISPLIS